jgi:hypothetical protein
MEISIGYADRIAQTIARAGNLEENIPLLRDLLIKLLSE